jgi:AcrR family transcriptional regulator
MTNEVAGKLTHRWVLRVIFTIMGSSWNTPPPPHSPDGKPTILRAAARLAVRNGLESLSVESLAEHLGMRKGLLFRHFSSDEKLQIATINSVSRRYDEEVVRPALEEPNALLRVTALYENNLAVVERWGGCFFASTAAEVDTRPGPARDLVADFNSHWLDTLSHVISQAKEEGFVRRDEDADQLAFEINSLLYNANHSFVLHQDRVYIDRARQAISRRLKAAAPQSA